MGFHCSVFGASLLILQSAVCFNIEVRNPVLKRGEPGTYFGFSVALHKTMKDGDINSSWILVGAPLADNLQPGTSASGALYKCPVPQIEDYVSSPYCTQVVTDGRRQADFDYEDGDSEFGQKDQELNPPGSDELKNGQWMGVNVRSQGPGGKVITCAHRYIHSADLQRHQFGLGLCYSFKSDLEWDEQWEPCKGRPMNLEHQQFGYCQAGTGLALLEDGTALIGAPGPYTWRGTVFVLDIVEAFITRDKTMYMGPLNDKPEPINKYSYLGMSVAGGRFFRENKTMYAAGAPRSQMHGQVYIFENFKKLHLQTMNITLVISGEQFGSSFGYEILVEDINQDGYDDLIVGAPFYFNTTEGGAIYVYYNLRDCTARHCPYDLRLTGPSESRYGFSMTTMGDINKDGYPDIAIGAPYEGGGAIYIYHGSAAGLSNTHTQKIHPEREFITTIGYSLSGGLDVDGNGYPDLLTGAYEVDRAYLFRTRQIVDIKVEVSGDELKNIDTNKKGCKVDPNNSNFTCFSFVTCFTVMSDDVDVDRVRCEIEESYDKIKYSRIWFSEPHIPDARHSKIERYTKVKKGRKKYCNEETVYIKEGIRDVLSPLSFKVNYTLANDSENMPLLNKTSVMKFQATFQKDCGSDDLCQSNLILKADSVKEIDLGEHDLFFYINVSVTNLGEPAYEANLYVSHPLALAYVSLDQNPGNLICQTENDTMVSCNLGNPFQARGSANLRMKFEVNQKQAKETELNVLLFVNSTSEELSKRTKVVLASVIKKRAELRMTGGGTADILYGGEVKGESAMRYFQDVGQRIWHTYQVENKGPWHVDDLEIVIDWPYQVGSDGEQGKWLLYLESVPEFDDKDNFCVVIPKDAVNPLGLNQSTVAADTETPPENLTMTPHKPRKVREVEEIVPEELKLRPDGKERQVVVMDCDRPGSVKCVQIICKIKKLAKGSDATVNIKSRIWNSTLTEDYSHVDIVRIFSRGRIHIPDQTITQNNLNDDKSYAETKAFPMQKAGGTGVSIWVYIGAMLAGLLLLIVLVVVLWKLGFFKRNRVRDPTLSGNLRKQGESETLLNK